MVGRHVVAFLTFLATAFVVVHAQGYIPPPIAGHVTDMAGKAKPHDFFSAMDLDHIEGKKKVPTPPPPRQP